MRKKTRDETPAGKAFRCAKNPYEVSNERVDLVSDPKLTGRDAAIAALARMKEREKTLKLHYVRVDDKTILCSNKKSNLEMRVKEYKSTSRV